MTNENYTIGGNLNTITKYNVNYDRIQILNFVCANYVKEILDQADAFNVSQDAKDKLQLVINKLMK